MNIAPYRKAIVALLGAVAAYAARRWDIGPEWADSAISALTAAGVFGVQNAPADAA